MPKRNKLRFLTACQESCIKKWMEPVDHNSEQPTRKSGSRIFLIIAIIIVASIAAFLILRPNPSGTTPRSTPASPTTSQ